MSNFFRRICLAWLLQRMSIEEIKFNRQYNLKFEYSHIADCITCLLIPFCFMGIFTYARLIRPIPSIKGILIFILSLVIFRFIASLAVRNLRSKKFAETLLTCFSKMSMEQKRQYCTAKRNLLIPLSILLIPWTIACVYIYILNEFFPKGWLLEYVAL